MSMESKAPNANLRLSLHISKKCKETWRIGKLDCHSILISNRQEIRLSLLPMFYHCSKSMEVLEASIKCKTDYNSAMYNVQLILLHRPFVSEGHLHSVSPSTASTSFSVCAHAAAKIVELLQAYEKTFSIRHAPYLIAYATYVAA
jgi:hypothetical protein